MNRSRKIFFFALLAAIGLRAAITIAHMAAAIPTHGDIAHPEAAVVARALDVAHGVSPYHDWREWPHDFSPYSPLTYYSVGLPARLFPEASLIRGIYLTGRILSFISIVSIAVALAFLASAIGVPRLLSLFAPLLFLTWSISLGFSVNYRPDAAQVLLSVLALLCVLPAAPPSRIRICAALALWSLGMWFKPVEWGVFAAIVWRASHGIGWRRAAGLAASCLAANLAAALALNALWDGCLLLNLAYNLSHGWSISGLAAFFRDSDFVASLIMAAGLASVFVHLTRSADPARRALALACGLSSLLAHLACMKQGAAINYHTTAFALAAVFGAALIHRLLDCTGASAARSALLLALAALAAADSLVAIWGAPVTFLEKWRARVPSPLAELARTVDGPVLVPFHQALALERPAPPTMLDACTYAIAVASGRISPDELVARINRDEFRLVVIPKREMLETDPIARGFPLGVFDAVSERCAVIGESETSLVLVPRAPAP